MIQLPIIPQSSIVNHLAITDLVLNRLAQQNSLAILPVQQGHSTGIPALTQIGNCLRRLVQYEPVVLLAQQFAQQAGTTARNTGNQKIPSLQGFRTNLRQSCSQQRLPVGQTLYQLPNMGKASGNFSYRCQQAGLTQDHARPVIVAQGRQATLWQRTQMRRKIPALIKAYTSGYSVLSADRKGDLVQPRVYRLRRNREVTNTLTLVAPDRPQLLRMTGRDQTRIEIGPDQLPVHSGVDPALSPIQPEPLAQQLPLLLRTPGPQVSRLRCQRQLLLSTGWQYLLCTEWRQAQNIGVQKD